MTGGTGCQATVAGELEGTALMLCRWADAARRYWPRGLAACGRSSVRCAAATPRRDDLRREAHLTSAPRPISWPGMSEEPIQPGSPEWAPEEQQDQGLLDQIGSGATQGIRPCRRRCSVASQERARLVPRTLARSRFQGHDRLRGGRRSRTNGALVSPSRDGYPSLAIIHSSATMGFAISPCLPCPSGGQPRSVTPSQ